MEKLIDKILNWLIRKLNKQQHRRTAKRSYTIRQKIKEWLIIEEE